MPGVLLAITILFSLAALADFVLGVSGDRRVRNSLVNFYIALEDGDWTVLYRTPASGVLRFMNRFLGSKPLTARYFVRSAFISVCSTFVLLCLSLLLSYRHSTTTTTRCTLPGFSQFLQIPAFIGKFLIAIFATNIVVDYFSWSSTQRLLRVLSTTRSYDAAFIIALAVVMVLATVFLMYLFYLPLSIMFGAWSSGISFGVSAVVQIMLANVWSISLFFSVPDYKFHISCRNSSHPIFEVSSISTMRILAVGVTIPALLLFISSIFGLLVYATRPFTQKPISLIVNRLEESSKPVLLVVAGVISAILVALSAISTYMKS
jgi:hypothetical protein